MRHLLFLLAVTLAGSAYAQPPADGDPRVEVRTNQGSFVIELHAERAPLTVQNFLNYVEQEHFSLTIFHRVIDGFMAQGGGYTPNFLQKRTEDPVVNESGNGLSNVRGTVAMARTSDPHSATTQFFVNLADNPQLDPRPDRWGYTVFGTVVEGMDVIDEIAQIPTGRGGPFPTDVPQTEVLIEEVRLL